MTPTNNQTDPLDEIKVTFYPDRAICITADNSLTFDLPEATKQQINNYMADKFLELINSCDANEFDPMAGQYIDSLWIDRAELRLKAEELRNPK